MKTEISVPTLGESVTEATVSSFLVADQSIVSSGQEIMELETDKVNQVLYAPARGRISFSVAIGQVVKIGEKVAVLDTEVGAEEKPVETKQVEKKEEIELERMEEPLPDVIKGDTTRKKMSSLRKVIASKLVEVKNTTAMLTTFNEVDMSSVIAMREKEKESFLQKHGIKLGFMSFFVKACVKALQEFPIIHSYIQGDEIVTPGFYDIGIAVSTDRGLVVPVVRKCEKLTLAKIEKEIAVLAGKAREGKLSIDDMQGGSFTITNGGVFGSLLSTPIINPSQSAILGMHAILKRPIAVNDNIEIRPMMYLALSYDHRIIDGREAVLFLIRIKENLENLQKLLSDNDLGG